MFKEQFDANDSLEDVKALRKILFESSLSLSRKNIIENSSVISAPHAVANMLYLDQRHELLLTFSDNLFNVTDTGPIKRSMAQNIADSGLSYDELHKLYTRFGKRGLVAILSNPLTTSSAKTPRVTRTKRILAAIVKHFEETSNEEQGAMPEKISGITFYLLGDSQSLNKHSDRSANQHVFSMEFSPFQTYACCFSIKIWLI